MKKYFMLIALCIITSICFAQKTYEQPEVYAEYPGGLSAMMKFLADNFKYPDGSKIEGKAMMSFVVDTDGSVVDIQALESPDERITNEAIRVIKMMPKWTPATNGGKKVRMHFTLPITVKPDKDNGASAGITIDGCNKIAKGGEGHKENPKGLYKLLTIQADNAENPQIPFFTQYKYMADSVTLQLDIAKDVRNSGNKSELHFNFYDNDHKVLKYTGFKEGDSDCLYDSDAKTFKFKWYNRIANFNSLMPYGHNITEMYGSGYGVDQRIRQAVDMLEGKFTGTNKFTGCWHRLGVIVKVDGMDMLLPGHQELYMLMDKDAYLQCYDLSSASLRGYFIFRPMDYVSDEKLRMFGDGFSTIEWMNDNTFKLKWDRGDGVIVTELWKRAGLPKRFQSAFGTNTPIFEVENPLPNYFGLRKTSDKNDSGRHLVSVYVKKKDK